MTNDEILVSSLFKFRVPGVIILIAYNFVSPVKMFHVAFVEVSGSNISPTSKPPYSNISFEIPVVEMHSRAKGILRMHYRRDPTCKKRYFLTRFKLDANTVDTSF